MAGIAVAAVLGAGWIVGEAAAVAALGQHLPFLPVAHQLAVGGIDDGGLLAGHDGLGHGFGRDVAILAAHLLRLVLEEPGLPLGRRCRPARFDRGVGRGRALPAREREIDAGRKHHNGCGNGKQSLHRVSTTASA